jgi:hypothetical protein
MSVKNLDMVAALTREGKAIDEALPIMFKHGYSVIKQVPTGANVVLSHQVKKDLTEVTHSDKEVVHISQDDALAILKSNADSFRSIDSACASLVADFLISDSRSQSAASDNKAWSQLKKELETKLGNMGIALGTLPQQWQNYWSKTKKALSLGFPVTSLVYAGKSGLVVCAGRYELQTFIKAQETKPDKLVTLSNQFEKLAIRLDGGDDGEGEIFAGGDITVSERAAAVLAEVALSNLSSANQSEAIASLGLAAVLDGLIAKYGIDSIKAELEQIEQIKKAA